MMDYFSKLFLVLFVCALAACGGGGGSGDEEEEDPPVFFTVATNASNGGSISPASISVASGNNASFTVTPDSGFTVGDVSGCGGALSGSVYTTGAIDSNCTVTATFLDNSIPIYSITTSAGLGGSISPASIDVNEGASAVFSIVPDAGFAIDVVAGCDGSLAGDTFTTGSITADCSVVASFIALTAPIVNAGADQTVDENISVALNGSAADADGSIVSYQWTQLSGPTVVINNPANAVANFVSPEVSVNETVVLQLLVTDNDGLTDVDTITITVENVVDNSVVVIAATGMPAAGFPSNYIYWSIFDPSIGASGHIAFRGAADVSIGSTSNNTSALWFGMPDNLTALIKENDALPGLPTNVLYGDLNSSVSNITPPVVTGNGNVAHFARLKGAVTTSSDSALLAYVDNLLTTVMREGDSAPGLPAGYLYGQVVEYAFSDAGLVFSAPVLNGGVNSGVGIWFWDFTTVQLIGFSEPFIDDLALPEESPDVYSGDCIFQSFSPAFNVQINDNGHIAFYSPFGDAAGRSCPVDAAFLVWENGSFRVVMADGQGVQGLSGYTFNTSLAPFITHQQLYPNGDVGIRSQITHSSLGDTRMSQWVIDEAGGEGYLALDGELLPGSSSATMSLILGKAPDRDAMGNVLVGAVDQTNAVSAYLLRGIPQSIPYSTIGEVGASQLQTLVKVGDIPPGFPPTAYFSRISIYSDLPWVYRGEPSMNSAGDVVFNAGRSDAQTPNQEVAGIWIARASGEIDVLLEQDDKILLNGNEVDMIDFPTFNGRLSLAGSGRYKVHSDNGQVLLSTQLENAYQAILLVSP